MNNKSRNNVLLAALVGLLAVAALGAWVMMSDGGNDGPTTVPVKPSMKVQR